MSNRFYDNEFEKYLKDQAEQHRMYPSDHVWRNIQHEIHGYKRWPALTFASIFIIAALVVSTVVLKPHTQLDTATPNIAKGNISAEKNPRTTSENATHLSVEKITQQTIADAIETVQSKQIKETLFIAKAESVPDGKAEFNSLTTQKQETASLQAQAKDENVKEHIAAENDMRNTREIISPAFLLRNDIGFSTDNYPYSQEHNNYHFTFASSYNADDDLNTRFYFNLSGRNNTNASLIKLNGNSKFDFQFYLTPSISYRRLVDNVHGALANSYISALPFNANYTIDVNRVIQHTSAAGYEVGFSVGYNLTKNLALRPGLQFNMRQYNIDAYVHSTEPAAISLQENGSNDVWNTVSGFRNISGSLPIVLKNRYYEISLPLGIDWRPLNKKFAWGIATSIQPTYTFDKEPFIISSNYKNYADGSKLMRNWNINANFETYLGYNTGNYRWQIGPQVRYQLLPTMNNSYPIREYLIDYGIKVGLVRSLK